ncbi:MAG: hypothetical protein R2867_33435 [Caldilineaceae bacterium]
MRSMFQQMLYFFAGGIVVLGIVFTTSSATATPTQVRMTSMLPARLGDETASTSQIHYQGRLLNPVTGQPKPDGAYTMVFNIYAAETGGAALWTESKNVLVDKGLFSTLLGDTTIFPAGLFNGQTLYLGVAIGGDPEAVPRQRIASVAYAVFASTAGNADTVDGKNATDFATAVHTHSGADLANNSIDSAKIVDGSVTSADIADTPRTITYPANSLAYNPGSTNIQPTFSGLRWKNAVDGAYLILPRPTDWDGTSDITFRIFFYPESSASGNVQFFIRPRVYNVGDTFLDTGGVLSNVAAVGVSGQYNELQITIPATRFGTKAWWYFVIQRNASVAGAYPDDVTVMTLAMTYTAVR